MGYKDYTARIEYSDEDECLIGRIAGISDVVSFHGDSVDEMRAAFIEAVEDYLETCEKIGKSPQKPFSGRFLLRLPSDLHARAAMMADAKGKSLNQWVTETLENAVHKAS